MGLVPECTEEDAVAEAKEFNSLSDTEKAARRAAEEKKRTDAIAAAVVAMILGSPSHSADWQQNK
jgi:hypothetical protein